MHLKKRIFIKKNDLTILILLLIITGTFGFYYLINKSFFPILIDYASRETEKISSFIVNRAVDNVIAKYNNNAKYINILTNDKGEIINVEYNTYLINEALSTINTSIEKDLFLFENGKYELLDYYDLDKNIYLKNNTKSIVFFLPFGIATGISVLSDLGPKIPVKLSLISSSKSTIQSELLEYGINNSLMKLYVLVSINIQVIMPFSSKNINIQEKIPLSINLVNGRIPEGYGTGSIITPNLNE